MVERRKFITGTVTAVTIAISGCTGSSNNGLSEEEIAEKIAQDVESEGFQIDLWEFDESNNWLGLDYFSQANSEQELRNEMATIGSIYSSYVEDSSAERLHLFGIQNDSIEYDYHIERGWALQFSDDEIDSTEFLGLIEDTLR